MAVDPNAGLSVRTQQLSDFFELENKGLSSSDLSSFKSFLSQALQRKGDTIYETDQGIIDVDKNNQRARTAPFEDSDVAAGELSIEASYLLSGADSGENYKSYRVPRR